MDENEWFFQIFNSIMVFFAFLLELYLVFKKMLFVEFVWLKEFNT